MYQYNLLYELEKYIELLDKSYESNLLAESKLSEILNKTNKDISDYMLMNGKFIENLDTNYNGSIDNMLQQMGPYDRMFNSDICDVEFRTSYYDNSNFLFNNIVYKYWQSIIRPNTFY